MLGTTLSACHFVPGQYVDVVANSYVLPFAEREFDLTIDFTASEKASRVV